MLNEQQPFLNSKEEPAHVRRHPRLLQTLTDALSLGSLYALIAIGYTMVYGVLRLINFAHGEIFMIAMYIVFYGISMFSLPWYVTFIVTILVTALLGTLAERLAYRPLRNAPRISILISAIGVSYFLQNLATVLFGGRPLTFPQIPLFTDVLKIGDVVKAKITDIDFEKKTLTVNKSYQRLGKEDIITTPKTPKSIRTIPIPDGLCTCLQEYMSHCYGLQKDDRLFPYTKSFLYHEMEYGCKASGVKRIRVHDIRHSHASLLVEMGFSPLLIAERLGHEKVQTTMDTYSHLYPNKQVEVARQLDGIMS